MHKVAAAVALCRVRNGMNMKQLSKVLAETLTEEARPISATEVYLLWRGVLTASDAQYRMDVTAITHAPYRCLSARLPDFWKALGEAVGAARADDDWDSWITYSMPRTKALQMALLKHIGEFSRSLNTIPSARTAQFPHTLQTVRVAARPRAQLSV